MAAQQAPAFGNIRLTGKIDQLSLKLTDRLNEIIFQKQLLLIQRIE